MNFQVFKTLKTEKFNENFCLPAGRQAGRKIENYSQRLLFVNDRQYRV